MTKEISAKVVIAVLVVLGIAGLALCSFSYGGTIESSVSIQGGQVNVSGSLNSTTFGPDNVQDRYGVGIRIPFANTATVSHSVGSAGTNLKVDHDSSSWSLPSASVRETLGTGKVNVEGCCFQATGVESKSRGIAGFESAGGGADCGDNCPELGYIVNVPEQFGGSIAASVAESRVLQVQPEDDGEPSMVNEKTFYKIEASARDNGTISNFNFALTPDCTPEAGPEDDLGIKSDLCPWQPVSIDLEGFSFAVSNGGGG